MKLPGWIVLSLLVAYSGSLVWVELNTSQAYVRQYFTDIEGDVLFYAVNTTLSVFLLAGTSLLLSFAALAGPGAVGNVRPFLLSQAAMFGLLALDDRFQLHERLGYRLGVPDHYVMLAWAAAEAILLLLFCRPRHVTARMAVLFLAGTAFFALMMVFDALVPADAILRLSIEDLAKSWGAAMFFGFGWEAARDHLQARDRHGVSTSLMTREVGEAPAFSGETANEAAAQ